MTSPLPHDIAGLALMVFLLGLRHGMDPDHLATLDGLARHNAQTRPRLARWSGCFFSLGHGAIVTLVAGFVAATLHDGAAPQWAGRFGTWIFLAVLLALGITSMTAGLRAPADPVWPLRVGRGVLFTVGMMTTEGVKGAWVVALVQRADRRARVASRAMGLAIGLLGIAIAALGMVRLLSQEADAALAGAELPIGFGLAFAVAASYIVAIRLARTSAA